MATRVRLFDLQPSGRCWPDEAYEEMLKYQGKLSILHFIKLNQDNSVHPGYR